MGSAYEIGDVVAVPPPPPSPNKMWISWQKYVFQEHWPSVFRIISLFTSEGILAGLVPDLLKMFRNVKSL